MKKTLLTTFLAGSLALAACSADLPEGVDQEFYSKAMDAFEEIHDDTMTLELSDEDDVANFQLLKAMADSKREIDFAHAMEATLKLQPKAIEHDGEALAEYLEARQSAMRAMEFEDTGALSSVSPFQFYEED